MQESACYILLALVIREINLQKQSALLKLTGSLWFIVKDLQYQCSSDPAYTFNHTFLIKPIIFNNINILTI